MGEKVDPQVWYNNFKKCVEELVNERKSLGYRVTRIIVTESVYNKINKGAGFEVDNILGYLLFISHKDDLKGDQVMIDGDPIQ